MCQPWFWGENCIHSFIYVFTYSTSISVILEAQGTWRLLTVHLHIFTPHISSYQDLVSAILFQKWPLRSHQWLPTNPATPYLAVL